ncbi:MAG: excinuclease ABC subunit UvrA [Cyanobacteria bacterium]|nr:excinuclease ABC subunit UvrA [Cyanobacteriota bacterium]
MSSKTRDIQIHRARTHTLKNITCRIPHAKLTVVTGPSGSGKSSLAFDTLYAEGQRRYIESMSSYARQFLERIEKPDVDRIDHILPAIALEQKNGAKNARSTVGTATDIYDYLRLLFAHLGQTRCQDCGKPVRRSTPEDIGKQLKKTVPDGSKCWVVAPVDRAYASLETLIQQGFFRFIQPADSTVVELTLNQLNEPKSVWRESLLHQGRYLVLIDRVVFRQKMDAKAQQRLQESLSQGFFWGQGRVELHVLEADKHPTTIHAFQRDFACTGCQRVYQEPTPALFSFNSPLGACPTCEGFGRIIGLDLDKVIPNKHLSLKAGAVHPFNSPSNQEMLDALLKEAKKRKIPVDVPYHDLSEAHRAFVIDGGGEYEGIRGFFDWLETKRYKMHVRVMLAKYRDYSECPDCHGARLRPEALLVTIEGHTLWALCEWSITALNLFFKDLPEQLSQLEQKIASRLLLEIQTRLAYLQQVGLHYLTLSRQMRTLSGGEAQRIQLSTALGSALTDTLYVLDEPTVGLHARDTDRLLSVIVALRDLGNTMVVVEHDPQMIRGADYILDMGPCGGEEGGRIVFEGTYEDLIQNSFSKTAIALNSGSGSGHVVAQPVSSADKKRARKAKSAIEIMGASGNNLKNIDVSIPTGQLVGISGVSGSGKSTLIKQTLYAGYQRDKGAALTMEMAPCKALRGLDAFEDVILVDQSPPARSLRSNPVTYLKAYDEIRQLMASTREAMVLGLKATDFSFNTAGGRCPSCEGLGFITVDMQFMADVTVVCDTCSGQRFKQSVLSVPYKEKNIHQILELTVDEAMAFFKGQSRLCKKLAPLQRIGLGYLRLGQSTTTLSGGEAQRLKLAHYLKESENQQNTEKSSGKQGVCLPSLFLFDEPTTGLHVSDIEVLVGVLKTLVSHGHSAVVIEHNLDFLAACDYLIDLGPDGGDAGGQVVATGTVAEIQACKASITGRYLKNY